MKFDLTVEDLIIRGNTQSIKIDKSDKGVKLILDIPETGIKKIKMNDKEYSLSDLKDLVDSLYDGDKVDAYVIPMGRNVIYDEDGNPAWFKGRNGVEAINGC